jgi:hypothetical protein
MWHALHAVPFSFATAAVFVSYALESARIGGCEHALGAGQGIVLDLGRGACPGSSGTAVCRAASCFRQRQQVQRHRVVQHLQRAVQTLVVQLRPGMLCHFSDPTSP